MQLLVDSLSRCFGIPLHSNNDNNRKTSLGAQPLGESKSRAQSDEDETDNQYVHETDNNTQKKKVLNVISSHRQRRRNNRRFASACCHNPSTNMIYDEDDDGLGQLSLSSNRYHNQNVTSMSSLSLEVQKDVLRKARNESTKRKLDIFRTDHPTTQPPKLQSSKRNTSTSSFASRFLNSVGRNSESSLTSPTTAGAILCFANPIFDSEDDHDARLFHSGNNNENDRDGEDTITSTLYFDAKYEHVAQNAGPPVPLWSDQALVLDDEHDDAIVKMYESGSIKHDIKSISINRSYTGSRRGHGENSDVPSPPPFEQQNTSYPRPKAISDSRSDDTDEFINLHCDQNGSSTQYNENDIISSSQEQCKQQQQQQQQCKIQSYGTDDGFLSAAQQTAISTMTSCGSTMSPLLSSPFPSKSRQDLDVISDKAFSKFNTTSGDQGDSNHLPSLRLMNNSSLSSHALTPVNSAGDGYSSPRNGYCTYMNQINDDGDHEDDRRMNENNKGEP